MNRFFSNTFKIGLLACVSVAAALSGTAQAQMVPEGGGMKQELADKGYNFRLYGKFRPKVTFGKNGSGDNTIDIRDDSSRVGIQGKIPISDELTAVLRGEWKVTIQDQGDFGDVRLAYAGLESKDAGFLGIGTQWNPYYDIVAVPVDHLYNASDTPVGYGQMSDAGFAPFRTNNFIKYENDIGLFKVSAGIQVDGSSGTPGVADEDGIDAFAVGVGFDVGKGNIGVAYWQQNDIASVGEKRTLIGIAGGFSVNESLYVGALYQDAEWERVGFVTTGGDTLDLTAIYSFGNGMKLLAGVYVDDAVTDENGVTLGLAKSLAPGMDVYIDWLQAPEIGDTTNQVNVGFRYNFDVGLL